MEGQKPHQHVPGWGYLLSSFGEADGNKTPAPLGNSMPGRSRDHNYSGIGGGIDRKSGLSGMGLSADAL